MESRTAIYTDEQLKRMAQQFSRVNSRLKDVFDKIAEKEDGIALHEINSDKLSGMGSFVRDKCIAALELPGLIRRYESGTQKICVLTEDGKRLKEILNSMI